MGVGPTAEGAGKRVGTIGAAAAAGGATLKTTGLSCAPSSAGRSCPVMGPSSMAGTVSCRAGGGAAGEAGSSTTADPTAGRSPRGGAGGGVWDAVRCSEVFALSERGWGATLVEFLGGTVLATLGRRLGKSGLAGGGDETLSRVAPAAGAGRRTVACGGDRTASAPGATSAPVAISTLGASSPPEIPADGVPRSANSQPSRKDAESSTAILMLRRRNWPPSRCNLHHPPRAVRIVFTGRSGRWEGELVKATAH